MIFGFCNITEMNTSVTLHNILTNFDICNVNRRYILINIKRKSDSCNQYSLLDSKFQMGIHSHSSYFRNHKILNSII